MAVARLRAAIERPRACFSTVMMLALAALAGCQTAPPTASVPVLGPGADAPWDIQRAALGKLERYNLTGRVAVAANGQGFSASLRYGQAASRSDLALDGPLGIGGLRISLDGQTLGMTNSKGEQLDGERAREEIERRLGFELPLAELRWWLLGIPAPGSAQIEDVNGEIRGFVQNGWHVGVNSRAPGLGFSLPQRLTAEREGAKLKLIVENWQP